MKISKSQAILIWYGSIIFGALAAGTIKPFYVLLALIQFLTVIFLFLDNEEGILIIKYWVHFAVGLMIFFLFFAISLALFENSHGRR